MRNLVLPSLLYWMLVLSLSLFYRFSSLLVSVVIASLYPSLAPFSFRLTRILLQLSRSPSLLLLFDYINIRFSHRAIHFSHSPDFLSLSFPIFHSSLSLSLSQSRSDSTRLCESSPLVAFLLHSLFFFVAPSLLYSHAQIFYKILYLFTAQFFHPSKPQIIFGRLTFHPLFRCAI